MFHERGVYLDMDIKNIVTKIVKKYKTTNPFEIMDELEILYVKSVLPKNVRGFCFSKLRRKIVVINSIYDKKRQIVTAAHELGHCILHPKMNAVFMDLNTYLIKSKYEKDAHQFAVELLTYNVDLSNYEGYTIEQVACALDIPASLLKLISRGGSYD